MAKGTGQLFSTWASGALGKTIVYTSAGVRKLMKMDRLEKTIDRQRQFVVPAPVVYYRWDLGISEPKMAMSRYAGAFAAEEELEGVSA